MAHASTVSLEVVRGADQAAALLHDVRRQLLGHLGQPESAASLARKLNLPRQRLTYHLRTLERDGLVEFVETRKKGNCVERLVRAKAQSYVISPEALGELGTTPETARDRFSAAYLMSATAKTIRDVASLDARAREAGKRIATFTLETDIRFATADDRAAFAQELSDAIGSLVAKYHHEHTPGGRRFRLMTAIHPALAATATQPAPAALPRARASRKGRRS